MFMMEVEIKSVASRVDITNPLICTQINDH